MNDVMAQLIKRQDRLEQRQDELQHVLVEMAKTESRVTTIMEQNTVIFSKMAKLQDDIMHIKIENSKQGQSISVVERVLWMLTAGSASVLGWIFKDVLK